MNATAERIWSITNRRKKSMASKKGFFLVDVWKSVTSNWFYVLFASKIEAWTMTVRILGTYKKNRTKSIFLFRAGFDSQSNLSYYEKI